MIEELSIPYQFASLKKTKKIARLTIIGRRIGII